MNQKTTIPWIVLWLLLVGLMFGCGQKAIQVKDGKLVSELVTITFGENAVKDGKDAILQEAKKLSYEKDNGLLTAIMVLTLKDDLDKPVALTMPLPEDFQEGEELFLGVGIEYVYHSGVESLEYFYLPVDIQRGEVQASFVPKDVMEASAYKGAGVEAGPKDPSKMKFSFGLFSQSVAYEKGHFKVYFPSFYKGKRFTHMLEEEDFQGLLEDLEGAYEKFQGLGYTYEERAFPISVYIKAIEDDASWHSFYQHMNLHVKFFEEGYQRDRVKPLIHHEFFHFVQDQEVGIFGGDTWISEATASYYESQVKGTTYTSITESNMEEIFMSVYPEKDGAGAGYGRVPLIHFLKSRTGDEAFIQKVYGYDGTEKDLSIVISRPPHWNHGYYLSLVSGNLGPLNTVAYHHGLVQKHRDEKFGYVFPLKVPGQEEMKRLLDTGEEILLGERSITIPGTGAKILAFTLEEKDYDNLPDGAMPTVICEDAEVTVVTALGNEMSILGASLTGIKDAKGTSKIYLALVTSKEEQGTAKSYDVRVVLSQDVPTFEELIGLYEDGIMTIQEVFVSDYLREELKKETSATKEEGADLGCDLGEMVTNIEMQKGVPQERSFKIVSTGKNQGILYFDEEEEDEDNAMTLTYEEQVGLLTGNLVSYINDQEVASMKGDFQASYSTDKKSVQLTGSFKSTFFFEEKDFYFIVELQGKRKIGE